MAPPRSRRRRTVCPRGAGAQDAGGSVAESPKAGVDGTHRASRRWQIWLWVFFAATQALSLVTSSPGGPGWAVWLHVFGAALGLTLAWMFWSQRTVVAARGLRVKAEWRWRDLPWDQVESVEAPSRWNP